MRVVEKAYAKINLALCVTGAKDGFHTLDSVVTTVDLYDTVTLTTRKDDKIRVIPQGNSEYVYSHIPQKDNAYKAVEAFMKEYGTNGADVVVTKRIPISSGMGGSSTDASAVLRAMQRAYKVKDADLVSLANSLGSDTAYLLKGGFARLNGRGEIITPLNVKHRINFVVVFCEKGVNTAECFKLFDQMDEKQECCDISRLIDSLQSETPDFSQCKNQLFLPAIKLNAQVKSAYDALKALSPDACFMTGSGSAVCAIFNYEPLCDWAVDRLNRQGFNAIKVRSERAK